MPISKYAQIMTILAVVGGPVSLVAAPAQATEPTADQAKENTSDPETMRNIRKAIMSDKSLSTYAHNVKIIAENGKVTLKGPVHTAEEKSAIEAKATEVAGAGNVVNEITVKGDESGAKAPAKTQ